MVFFFVPEKVKKKKKMNSKWFVFAVAVMLSSSVFAAGQESSRVIPNLGMGAKVFEGSGNIDLMGDQIQFQLAYGQFVTDAIEVAVVAGLRDNDSYMSTELGVRVDYNFVRDSALVPFLTAGVVWADVEADGSNLDTDAAVFSIGGGAKYFVRDNVALALSGSYLTATDDIFLDSEDGRLKGDEFRILFSVRFYFR